MRKLHFYGGNCIHYSPKPGMKIECDKGIDIRALVGGEDHGWMTRMPCSKALQKDAVPCGLAEFPTKEQLEADREQLEKNLRAIANGACPECGTVLRLRETDSVQLQECPNGHVSMRGCKRIGRDWPRTQKRSLKYED